MGPPFSMKKGRRKGEIPLVIHFSGMSFWTRINLKPEVSNALGNGR